MARLEKMPEPQRSHIAKATKPPVTEDRLPQTSDQ